MDHLEQLRRAVHHFGLEEVAKEFKLSPQSIRTYCGGTTPISGRLKQLLEAVGELAPAPEYKPKRVMTHAVVSPPVAERLKRVVASSSQIAVARDLGVNPNSVSRWSEGGSITRTHRLRLLNYLREKEAAPPPSPMFQQSAPAPAAPLAAEPPKPTNGDPFAGLTGDERKEALAAYGARMAELHFGVNK